MLGRIMVALVGIPLLIVILFFSPVIVLTVAFSALCAIAAYELLGATQAVHNRRLVVYAALFSALVPLWYYFGCRIVGAVGGVFVLMLLLFGEAIASRQTMQVEEMAMTVFAALVVPSMLSVFVLMADLEHARLYMAFHEGQPIAGTLAIHYGDKVWYLYGASSNEHRNLMPNYLLQWSMIQWAVETGCRIYDFRGVSGNVSEDNPLYGLFRFKQGFGGAFTEFVGEEDLVLSPFIYWAVEHGTSVFKDLRKTVYLIKNRGKK